MKTRLPEDVRKFLGKIGSKGGRKRAAAHSPEQLSAFGAAGGRPPSFLVKQRDGVFWLGITVDGVHHRESLGVTKLAEAKARAAVRMAEIRKGGK